MPVRKLSLKRETLAELTTDELRSVAGAASTPSCAPKYCFAVSNYAESLCGCFSEYCSIDVC